MLRNAAMIAAAIGSGSTIAVPPPPPPVNVLTAESNLPRSVLAKSAAPSETVANLSWHH